MYVRFCIFLFLFAFTFAKDSNEITLIMGGDALLHTSVYKDAEYDCKVKPNKILFMEDSINSNLRNDFFNNNLESKTQNTESKKQPAAKIDLDSKNMCYDFSPMFEMIKPYIARYDLAFYNQETILGGKEMGLSSYPNFNSPKEFGENMLSLGFNLISLANNHTLDRGENAILESIKFWKDKDVLTAGSYNSLEERNKIKIYKKNGITYTMLAYTYGTNGIPLPKGKEYLVNVYTKEMLAKDIAEARSKVDLLIISMHWGVEYVFKPTNEQEELAKFLSQNGADIIIGNHPHVIQPIEMINNTLVIYSLGNMISAQKGTEKKIGAFVDVKITKNGNKITFENINADLIYTYYNNKFQDFKIYPLAFLNDNILPNYRNIFKDYVKILLERDSKNQINIGIFK